jgi:hypothetical protein
MDTFGPLPEARCRSTSCGAGATACQHESQRYRQTRIGHGTSVSTDSWKLTAGTLFVLSIVGNVVASSDNDSRSALSIVRYVLSALFTMALVGLVLSLLRDRRGRSKQA